MESQVNFYLSSLEEQVQSELNDDEAKLSQSAVEGRVLLNIREDSLASFLDRLQERQENVEWTQEKGLLQKQICDLKAQLDLAQAKQGQCPTRDTKHLKPQLARTNAKLRQTEKDLEQQACINKDMQAELEQVKAAKAALETQVESMSSELSIAKQLQAAAEDNTYTTKDRVYVLELELAFERAQIKKLNQRLAGKGDTLQKQKQKQESRKTLEETQTSLQLKTQLARTSAKLRETEKDLEQQATTNKDLHAQMEELRRVNEAHQKESEAQQLELHAKRQLESNMAEAWRQQQMLTSSIHYLHAVLEHMKGEKLALDRELEAKRLEVNGHLQFIASAKTNVELELESQLKVEREQAQKNLEQQACINKDMQAELEQVKAAKAALETQVESMSSELSIAKQLQAAAEDNTETTKDRVYVLELELAFERAQIKKLNQRLAAKGDALQKQKQESRKTLEETQTSLQLQLEKQRAENNKMAAALKEAEELLDGERVSSFLEKENSEASHLAEMAKQREHNNKLTFSLKKADEEMHNRHLQWQKEKSVFTAQLDELHRLHSAQLELTERNHKNYMAALKIKYDQKQQRDSLQWQQERTSLLAEAEKDRDTYVSQLNKEKEENSTLVDALKKAEEQLQSQRNIWQEESASLLQARESLNETLQAMEQKETTMRRHIEELEQKIAKKKTKKWYRLFGACNTTGSVPQTHINTS